MLINYTRCEGEGMWGGGAGLPKHGWKVHNRALKHGGNDILDRLKQEVGKKIRENPHTIRNAVQQHHSIYFKTAHLSTG
jgi:hypothetical protein